MDNRIPEGNLYSVIWFDIKKKRVIMILKGKEGTLTRKKLRWNRDMMAILQLFRLVEPSVTKADVTGLTIYNGESIQTHLDGWNSGPIVCTMLQIVLSCDNGMENFRILINLKSVPFKSNYTLQFKFVHLFSTIMRKIDNVINILVKKSGFQRSSSIVTWHHCSHGWLDEEVSAQL